MSLTLEALAARKAHFRERTAHGRDLGYNRVVTRSLIPSAACIPRPVTVDWARGFACALGMTDLRASVTHPLQVSVLRAPAAEEKR